MISFVGISSTITSFLYTARGNICKILVSFLTRTSAMFNTIAKRNARIIWRWCTKLLRSDQNFTFFIIICQWWWMTRHCSPVILHLFQVMYIFTVQQQSRVINAVNYGIQWFHFEIISKLRYFLRFKYI